MIRQANFILNPKILIEFIKHEYSDDDSFDYGWYGLIVLLKQKPVRIKNYYGTIIESGRRDQLFLKAHNNIKKLN